MQTAPRFLVFSDLDGTLLDHNTYGWDAAKPALARLAHINAPLILATSKTAAETQILQRRFGLDAYPAIVENGAGLCDPPQKQEQKDTDYQRIRDVLAQMPHNLRERFQGFGDMDTPTVADFTGLSAEDALRARTRMFSEPGLWHGSQTDRASFVDYLADYGISARAGGRFLTLSFGATKRDRMAQIIATYTPQHTIALGDAPNDIEMICAADLGVIIANPHHPPLPALDGEETGRIIRTEIAGPAGWNAAIHSILDRELGAMKGKTFG